MRHVFMRGAEPFSDDGTDALEDAPSPTSARDRSGSFVDGACTPGQGRPREAAACEEIRDSGSVRLRCPSPGLVGSSIFFHAELQGER
jgi:hypothetical protein